MQQMPNGQNRVRQQHSGPGITHDDTCLFLAVRLIAVNRTLFTGGFDITVRTLYQPEAGKIEKGLTVTAYAMIFFERGMVIPTINPGHGDDGFELGSQYSG